VASALHLHRQPPIELLQLQERKLREFRVMLRRGATPARGVAAVVLSQLPWGTD